MKVKVFCMSKPKELETTLESFLATPNLEIISVTQSEEHSIITVVIIYKINNN